MELAEYVGEGMVSALQRLLPGFPLRPKICPMPQKSELSLRTPDEAVSVELPAPVGADYSFGLSFLPERQIYAQLLKEEGADLYFWYMPFEEADYSNSIEQVDAAFLRALERIARHQTRIIQKHGILLESFSCEYNANAHWERLYGMSALRIGGFEVPQIRYRKKVYSSPPVSSVSALA